VLFAVFDDFVAYIVVHDAASPANAEGRGDVKPVRAGGLVFRGGLFFASAGVPVGLPAGDVQARDLACDVLEVVSM
jgi:hypothetical protein